MSRAAADREVKGAGRTDADAGLLERDHELEAIEEFVAGIDGGGPRLLLIEGPAGIGKSALLEAARGRARGDGIRALSARGSLLEREFPFGVVRQLFEPSLAVKKERAQLLAGAAASAETVFGSLDGEESAGGDASFAALHGLYWLTVNVGAERPLLLVIDDLHWVDHPSLRFIAYMSSRLEGVQIGVIAATRPN